MTGSGTGDSALPIVQYWDTEEIPAEVRALTATFRDRNPDMPYLLFDEPAAERLIAEHFGERELAAFRACAVPAMQSDYFRCCAIYALGGIYADVSFVCRQPLRSMLDTIESGLLITFLPGPMIHNGAFVFKAPGHPFLRLAVELMTANIERRVANAVNMVTGPWVFTCLAEWRRAGSTNACQWAPNPTIERLARAMAEGIEDDPDRLEAAFRDIQIEPPEGRMRWMVPSEERPAYKDSETDWRTWPKRRGSIYR